MRPEELFAFYGGKCRTRAENRNNELPPGPDRVSARRPPGGGGSCSAHRGPERAGSHRTTAGVTTGPIAPLWYPRVSAPVEQSGVLISLSRRRSPVQIWSGAPSARLDFKPPPRREP
jgi:hypothetical protein